MNDKICTNCYKTCNRIRKTFCNTCYTKYRIHGDPNYYLAGIPDRFTEQQTNVIIGSMLGDGHIRKRKDTYNASMSIKRAAKDLKYLKWEADVFNGLLTKAGIIEFDQYDERTNKIYHACSFETRTLIAMNAFHGAWYKNKIKVIPNDLKLNAEIIAVWFCDDGHIDTSSSDKRFVLSFATNSFSKDEVYFLCDLLKVRYNEHFLVGIRHDTEDKQRIIHCADSAARTLITDIDSVFPKGMQRKRLWDDPKTCFYENTPPRRRSHQLSSSEKRLKIVEYLKAHSEFYLNDLGKFAGFSFDRKSRDVKSEIATTNITRHYLNDYLKNELIVRLPIIETSGTRKRVKYVLTEAGKLYFQQSTNHANDLVK